VKEKNRNRRGTFTMLIEKTIAANPRHAVESADAFVISIASASIEDSRLDLYRPQSEKRPCHTIRSTREVTQFESFTLIERKSGRETLASECAMNMVASANDNTNNPRSTDFSDNNRNRRLASFTGFISQHGSA
jgi:hypothetical protein